MGNFTETPIFNGKNPVVSGEDVPNNTRRPTSDMNGVLTRGAGLGDSVVLDSENVESVPNAVGFFHGESMEPKRIVN